MDRNQINRTDMQNTVAAYMDKNNPLWSGVKATNDTVTELKGNNAAIAEKAAKQQAPISGAGDEKVQVRLDFEEKILEIADQLSALAEKNKDVNLAAQVGLSLSALDKMDVDALEQMGKAVSGLATANLAVLADYDIDQADVTELDGWTAKFYGVKNAVRAAIAGRSGETQTMPQLISANTSLLRNRLDKQMTKFKKSNPEFYAGYQSARVIVDRGGGGGSTPTPPTPPPAPPK